MFQAVSNARYGGRKPDAIIVSNVNEDRLSKHFSESEFWCRGQEQGTCNCNHSIYIEPRLIAMLEKLREVCGNRPLYINSGYRCPQHNAAIGGVPDSQHCLGTAADVARPEGITFEQFKKCVEQLPFDGIGFYPYDDFIHVDIREGGYSAGYRW